MKPKQVMIYVAAAIAILAIASGCHRRFGHGDFPEKALEHIDDRVADLNLTETQQTRYQELRVRLAADLEKLKVDHKSFRDQFKARVNNDNAEVTEITGLIREKSQTIPTTVSRYLDFFEEFYAMLDQTQQTELRNLFRKKMNRYWD
ncbi:Spy/CpxP family protein refolding chaperone [bacterium]|nr:Spy/CpxP family protein refolding chaperone [bacterium]